jgi:murein DD-endopeptidase MepM/ murein hydrolase activator NlpD
MRDTQFDLEPDVSQEVTRPPAPTSTDALGLIVALKVLATTALVLVALGVFASVFAILGTGTGEASAPVCTGSPLASDGIPSTYLRLYQETGASFGLDWSVLAAIGYIESGHGANVGPSSAGALGPMQFLPSTWDFYGVDGDGDGRRDVMDYRDAIPAAANLLRANGAPANWERAIFAYNHADWYVRQVLAQAERYRGDCAAGDWPGGSGRLAWPVQGPITSPFCERRSWERCHPGLDIAVPSGTPVHAAGDGTVTLARPVSGSGNIICITHTPRLTTSLAHLSQFRTHAGARDLRGDVVGLSGCTGRCFGPH